jgi:phage-related minor tail protein
MIFNAQDWYWYVGGDMTKVYSSNRNVYVDPAVDAAFQTWAQNYISATSIDTEKSLWGLVGLHFPSWLFNGSVFSQPAVGVYTKSQLISYASQVRYDTQISGTVAAGIPVATDDRGLMLINGARWAADGNTNWTSVWVGTDGQHYNINQAQMIQIASIVTNRTEQTYTTYDSVVSNINNQVITTLADIDKAFAGII